MAFFAAIIYMKNMLKYLGIIAWTGCLLSIAFQALTWVISASWPSITLMDALSAVSNTDYLTFIESLPFDIAIKAMYLCFTTQLSLFLWWFGVCMFSLFALKVVFLKK